ncbi:N-acetylmuramic acid 6-phosphate etherase [Paenibacillus sp. N3.4]|uniref:N-acetylmuramic acid 6-phosphate etherase n=1 Tax=Paenibacillus sp. N3.4 TaxID=2603222 RepID=UPI0011C708D2|nr:N-acetylmuramic acid 6-phosphate etherase [Paenibacillus sp. N3.4]TXK83610.1 N-acetylmuramic acid 6-phosphate etherase [Paenibacillus sp. N3.4]
MSNELKDLTTERRSGEAMPLDTWDSFEIVRRMNQEDRKVADAVNEQLAFVAKAVDLITGSLEKGGRLFYFGAGTSGRLGVLDASECPPTFGTDSDLVQGVIAGGEAALLKAIEGAEDYFDEGVEDVGKNGVREGDVVVGIAASGRTPYVMGAMSEARRLHAFTVSVSCNANAEMNELADVPISVVVGPEIISGSTRLKAGTAQKLVLNMLTTASMIRLGKVYGDLMVNVQPTNYKLRERVKRIVADAAEVTYEHSEKLVAMANGDPKVAIVMHKRSVNADQARTLLQLYNGRIRPSIDHKDNNES